MISTTLEPRRRHPDSMPTRAIVRTQLRRIVTLDATSLEEMERRGEFPRRFPLARRCVVWDLTEVEAWLAERQHSKGAATRHSPASSNGRQ